MWSIFILVLREALEISIILSLVLCATKNLPNRNLNIILGIILGFIGAYLLTFSSGSIDEMFDGIGQEIVNGTIALFTAIMIGSTLIWLNKNISKTIGQINEVSQKIATGEKNNISLISLVAFLMFREGSEIGIYLVSIRSTHNIALSQIIFSSLLALSCAVMFNFIFYISSLKFLKKYIFKISNYLLLLVASGMAAQAANYFIAADILPELITNVWDSSALISVNSTLGKILNLLAGYDDRPNLMSLIFYLACAATIGYFLHYNNKQNIKAT
jgi:high-affinity iron transporter